MVIGPAFDQIKHRFVAVQQLFQIPESLGIVENLDKVVAGTGRVVGDGNMIKTHDSVDDFVEGTVAAAGVKTNFLTAFSGFPGQTGAVTGAFGNQNIVFHSKFTQNCCCSIPDLHGTITFSCSRIDDKDVFHW